MSVEVRLHLPNQSVKDCFAEEAAQYDLKLTQYLRWRLGCPLNEDPDPYLSALHRVEIALNAYGNNLNQTTRGLNQMLAEGSYSAKGNAIINEVNNRVKHHAQQIDALKDLLHDCRSQ